jgi:SNF2 family DNA or RNA helicase
MADYETHFKECGYDLYPHQKEGIRFMQKREDTYTGTGGILADDVGLGKTIQAAALVYSRPGHTLIAGPIGVMPQWAEKLNTLLPKDRFEIVEYYGSGRSHINIRQIINTCDDEDKTVVVLATYGHIASNNTSPLQSEIWDRFILDEGHYARNPKTKLHYNCCRLTADTKWILTATPVQNKANDLYALLYIVCKLEGTTKLKKREGVDKIITLRDTYLLRRHKQEILHTLPPLVIENINCKFVSEAEQTFYRKIEERTTEAFKRAMKRHDENFMIEVLELLLRLRQTTFHPQLVIDGYKKKGIFAEETPDWEGPTTKLHYLEESVLKEMKETPDQRTLIFCQFRKEMTMIEDMLRGHGFTTFLYNGDTRAEARKDVVMGLLRPQFLIIQIKAGGAGLNLQMYNRVYITSADWNPSNEFQAIGRSHRSGQKKPVKVTRLLLHWNDAYNQELQDMQKQVAKLDKRIHRKEQKLNKAKDLRTKKLKENPGELTIKQDMKIIDLQRKIMKIKEVKTELQKGHKLHTIDHRIFQLQKQKTDIQADVLNDVYLKQAHDYKTNDAVAVNLTESNYRDLLMG